MDYVIKPGSGRDDFVRYWRLIAEAVQEHPSAFAFELMNEPMTIRRKWYMDAWKAAADAIHEVIPDASVSICDVGEASLRECSRAACEYAAQVLRLLYRLLYHGAVPGSTEQTNPEQKYLVPVVPSWVPTSGDDFDISAETLSWIKSGTANVFYAWHYGDANQAVKNMQASVLKLPVVSFYCFFVVCTYETVFLARTHTSRPSRTSGTFRHSELSLVVTSSRRPRPQGLGTATGTIVLIAIPDQPLATKISAPRLVRAFLGGEAATRPSARSFLRA